MIPYAVSENHLTSDPDDHLARVISVGTVDQDALVDDIIKRGTTVTRPDLLAVLDTYHKAIIDRLLEGYRITTPTANYGVTIKGCFEGPADEFDHSRHLLNPADSRQGVFFVAGDGSAVQATMVMRNKPADLTFMVPDGLAAGEYSLEVRTAPTAESDLRTGRLCHTLIVT